MTIKSQRSLTPSPRTLGVCVLSHYLHSLSIFVCAVYASLMQATTSLLTLRKPTVILTYLIYLYTVHHSSIEPLGKLKFLHNLNLRGNPVTLLPDYQTKVCACCPPQTPLQSPS